MRVSIGLYISPFEFTASPKNNTTRNQLVFVSYLFYFFLHLTLDKRSKSGFRIRFCDMMINITIDDIFFCL